MSLEELIGELRALRNHYMNLGETTPLREISDDLEAANIMTGVYLEVGSDLMDIIKKCEVGANDRTD
jgi:hypothetical protein